MPEINQEELTRLTAAAAAGETAAAALEVSAARVGELEGAGQRAQDATAALLQTTREANPNIPGDLINGEDPATIAASVEGARAIVARVSELNPTAPAGGERPPGGAGSPPRTAEVPAGLRGLNRIAYALSNPGPGNTEG
jgi:hypothetical protein